MNSSVIGQKRRAPGETYNRAVIAARNRRSRRGRRIDAARVLWAAGVSKNQIGYDLGVGPFTLLKHMPDRMRSPTPDNHGDRVLDRIVLLAAQSLATQDSAVAA